MEKWEIVLAQTSFCLVSATTGVTGNVPPHVHSSASFELHYVKSGRGLLKSPEGEWMLTPGILYLTGPGVRHEQVQPAQWPPVTEICIYYTAMPAPAAEKTFSPLVAALQQRKFWLGPCPDTVLTAMENLYRETVSGQQGSELMVPLLLGEFLLTLGRLYSAEPARQAIAEAPLEQKKYLLLERYFLGEPATLTMEGLSRTLHLSIRQTQRLLQTHYHATFLQMRDRVRLEAVQKLLRETDAGATVVAEKAGFATLESCEKWFRQRTGMSLRQYRKTSGAGPLPEHNAATLPTAETNQK